MKLISWNVNGIRAALKNGFLDFFKKQKPDILCLQETKAEPEQVDAVWPKGYHEFWNPAERKGYSGTTIFTKTEPKKVTRGIGAPELDTEGRVITAEFEDFILVNVYTPNSQRELTRLDYRTTQWEPAFLRHLRKLKRRKPVVVCGDLNCAHKEIDLANPKQNVRNAGFTAEERACFDALIKAGFVDTFREFESGPGHYSWWTYRGDARSRNIGWRIDYFLVSGGMVPRLKRAFILPEVLGSDHCPVGIEIK